MRINVFKLLNVFVNEIYHNDWQTEAVYEQGRGRNCASPIWQADRLISAEEASLIRSNVAENYFEAKS